MGELLAATEPAWVLAGVIALALRYRRASGPLRAELRWPVRALVAFVVTLLATIVVHAAFAARGHQLEAPLVGGLFLLAFAAFPVRVR